MIGKFVVFFMIVFSQISFAGNICGVEVDDRDAEIKPQKFTTYHILDLFEIDQTLTDQQPVLDEAFKEIQKNPVGHYLIHYLCTEIKNYPEYFKKIEHLKDEQNKYRFDSKYDLDEDFEKHKGILTKIFLILNSNERTVTNPSHTLRKDVEIWSDEKTYKKHQIKISLKNLEDGLISTYDPKSFEICQKTTPFYMILAHELIHAAQVVEDQYTYTVKSTTGNTNEITRDYWYLDNYLNSIPLTENDPYAQCWDGRITELLAVIGRRNPIKGTQQVSNIQKVSELTMRLAGDLPVRYPYSTDQKYFGTLDKGQQINMKFILDEGTRQKEHLLAIKF